MTVTPTEAKIQKIKSRCDTLLKTPMRTIKQVAEVIGILVSNFPGAQYEPLHYRNVDSLASKGHFCMTLARQRVLSSSEVRASDLEHGGSWVRIPSGAQIFSVSSYG